MLKMHLAAGLAAAALMTSAAVAQTTPAPAGGGAAGQLMTQMQPNMMRGSKLMGVDVYGSDNQKIGDIDEVLVDREGKIQAIVVGIGGFLGIGEKNVAIPYTQVQWMTAEQASAANTQAGGTNTAGGVTTPASPTGTAGSGGNQPATTGSTGAGGTAAGGSGAGGSNDGTPARAMVRMSKADLQNAPEFRYSADAGGGGAGGTNPPATTNRPAAPQ